jgi:hypothetical protein
VKTTFDPGLATSKSLPILLNASVSDAAAKTLILPVTVGAPDVAVGVAAGVELPQAVPVRVTAMATKARP